MIPHLSISSTADGLKELPAAVFELSIPQIMPVMSALVFSIMIGLAAAWTKAELISNILEEFQKIVLAIVSKIMIPILPFFIGLTFCGLSYEGSITKQVPVFLKIIIIVLIGHYIWMTLLYTIAGLYSKKNPIEVIRHYGPAYLTSIGTMSSVATLAVALQCAGKSKVLRKDMVSFGIPLFANIHLCGSVLTEVFFLHDCIKDFVWHYSISRNYDSVLCASRNICNRRTWRTWRNSYGFARTYYRRAWI